MNTKKVLAFWGLAECEIELRVRRLRWWQAVSLDPANSVQLLAAVFGKYRADPQPTVFESGALRCDANPWALRFAEDLK
eukprot:9228166-Lingulodinium_polyedra.AAC.1